MSSTSPSFPSDDDKNYTEVVTISETDSINFNTSSSKSSISPSIRSGNNNVNQSNSTSASGVSNVVTRRSGLTKEREEYYLQQERFKAEKRLHNFAKDQDNPANWMYKSFRHPVHGKNNLRKGEKAAIKIQAVFRGKRARNVFLYMYENKNVLSSLGIYLFFYSLILCYVYFKKTKDDGFLMQSLLRDLILDEEFLESDTQIYKNYHDIASTEEFWQYMHGPLANGVFPPDCYDLIAEYENKLLKNGQNLTHTFNETSITNKFPCLGMIYKTDMLMGGIRLSTYRSEREDWKNNGKCSVPEQMVNRLDRIGCYPTWGASTPESDANFLMSGQSVNRTLEQKNSILKHPGLEKCFTTDLANEISHYGFSSQSGTKFSLFGFNSEVYSPQNSYICEMVYTDGHHFRERLKALEEAEWVDYSTRAVMIEFSVVNPNVGMSTSVRLFVEFLATGGVATYSNFATSWLFSLYSPMIQISYWVLVIALLSFALYYIFEELGELKEAGCSQYCQDLTNVADIFNYVLLIIVLLIDFLAQQEERKALSSMGTPDYPNYVNYVAINYINDFGNWLQSLNIVILTLKLFKYFRVSPKLNIMLLTISRAGSTMAYFLAIMVLTVIGFAMAFYCAFNAELEQFQTIDRSIGTLLFAVLGDSVDFREISKTNRILAPLFSFLFTFVVSILFFSLFITMVDEAYNAVKEEQKNKRQDISTDILMNRLGVLKRRTIKNVKRAMLCVLPCLPKMYELTCKTCRNDEDLLFESSSDDESDDESHGKGKRTSLFSFLGVGTKNKVSKRGKGNWVREWQRRRKREERKRELYNKLAHEHKKQLSSSMKNLRRRLKKEEESVGLTQSKNQRSKYALSVTELNSPNKKSRGNRARFSGGFNVEDNDGGGDDVSDNGVPSVGHFDSIWDGQENFKGLKNIEMMKEIEQRTLERGGGEEQKANTRHHQSSFEFADQVQHLLKHFEQVEKNRDQFVSDRFYEITELLKRQLIQLDDQQEKEGRTNNDSTNIQILNTTDVGGGGGSSSSSSSSSRGRGSSSSQMKKKAPERSSNFTFSSPETIESNNISNNNIFIGGNKVEGSVLYWGETGGDE